jgi:hypothetical protein
MLALFVRVVHSFPVPSGVRGDFLFGHGGKDTNPVSTGNQTSLAHPVASHY